VPLVHPPLTVKAVADEQLSLPGWAWISRMEKQVSKKMKRGMFFIFTAVEVKDQRYISKKQKASTFWR